MFAKVEYKDQQTIIQAKNLNDIQDAILKAVSIDAQNLTDAQKAQARANIGAITAGEGGGGEDGYSPSAKVEQTSSGAKITITDKTGTTTATITNGSKGDPGRGIVSIARTSGTGAAGTTDTYTITYTDNTKSTFTVYNGANGKDGTGGGSGGEDGEDGATFTPYVDANGNLSWSNDKGLPNPRTVNIKGADGKTPVRGTDYWTDADKAEIKSYVDDAILGGAW